MSATCHVKARNCSVLIGPSLSPSISQTSMSQERMIKVMFFFFYRSSRHFLRKCFPATNNVVASNYPKVLIETRLHPSQLVFWSDHLIDDRLSHDELHFLALSHSSSRSVGGSSLIVPVNIHLKRISTKCSTWSALLVHWH